MRRQGKRIGIVLMILVTAAFGIAPDGSFGSGGRAFAAEAAGGFGGDGSSEHPFLIGTAGQLNGIRDQYLGADLYFQLTNDIDLSGYASGAGWLPIGTVGAPFLGHFDGGGHTITGLTIDGFSALGLFGSLGPGGSVMNVQLKEASVHGVMDSAGLVGWNDRGTIVRNCVTGSISGVSGTGGLVGTNGEGGFIQFNCFSGSVTGKGPNTGGLIGTSVGEATISDNDVSGTVSGTQFVGGLTGTNNGGGLMGNYVSADVSGSGNEVGGLVGYQPSGNSSRSFASGDVSGQSSVGGLVGHNGSGRVYASGASGDVTGGRILQYVGGLVGYSESGEIQGSYASGNVGGYTIDAGGLVGYLQGGELRDSYAEGDVQGAAEVGGLVGRADHASISNSYATGTTTADEPDYAGGLIGDLSTDGLTLINSFYDRETNGKSDNHGGTGLSSAAMRDQGTYEADSANGWDFASTWAIDAAHHDGYPYLRAIQFFLDYDGNGNTGGSVPTDAASYRPGEGATVLAGTGMARTGFVFKGWNTQEDGFGTDYAAGDAYGMMSSSTLFAKWRSTGSIASLTSSIGTVSTGETANETIAHIPYGTTLEQLRAALAPDWNATFAIREADGVTPATALATGTKIIVTSEDGTAATTYTAAVDPAPPSSEKAFTAFSFAAQTGPAVIDADAHTVTVEVQAGTDRSRLTASFALSGGASAAIRGTAQTSGASAVDFSSPVTYTVTAADGSTQSWTVVVTAQLSSEKAITYFDTDSKSGPVVIDPAAHTVTVEVQPGTDRHMLMAQIMVSPGASLILGGMPQYGGGLDFNDFSNPVTYTVTAEDGSVQDWTVTVNEAAPPTTDIVSFAIGGQIGPAMIDRWNHTVALQVAPDHVLSRLTASFTLSDGATATIGGDAQTSGATVNDFTNPVVYTVAGTDGRVQNWTVSVTFGVPMRSGTDMTAFSLNEQTGAAAIDPIARTIAVAVRPGTDLGSLRPTFELSEGAAAFVDNMVQTSGMDAHDFTRPVSYVVMAENGDMQLWTVTVTTGAEPASSEKDITAFRLSNQAGPAAIDAAAHTIAVEVAAGSDLSGLTATFSLSAGATAKVGDNDQTSGVTANDFTHPVVYAVKAADGSVQEWTVTVTTAAAPSSLATLTSTIGIVSAGGTGKETITDVPADTSLEAFEAAITPAAGAAFGVYEADGKTPAAKLASGCVVIVTAQDGVTTAAYTVTLAASNPTTPPTTPPPTPPTTPPTPPSSSGSGEDGGGTAPSDDKPIVSTDGNLTLPPNQAGEVSFGDAVTVSIPPGATDRELKMTIDEVTDAQKLIANNDTLVSAVYEMLKNFQGKFASPITLTFSFDASRIPADQTASVFYYDEVKRSWVEVPEGVIVGNRITVSVDHFTKFAVFAVDRQKSSEPAAQLSDIGGHWAEADIRDAVGQGIAAGYPDGNFRPDRAVTRAEFAVMLVRALKLQGEGAEPRFNDAPAIGAWAKDAVAIAAQQGFVHGYEDGDFRPNAPITRAEMAAMAARAAGLGTGASGETGFADDGDIPAWAKSAVAAIRQQGIAEGEGANRFAPAAHATRAEAVTMLLKMLSRTKA